MAMQVVVRNREIDANLAAVCGAYCGACPVYRAWAEQDRPRLEALAASLRVTPDRLVCTGCRSPAAFCFGGECEVKTCAQHRGVAFCTECEDYPCNRIRRSRIGEAYRTLLSQDAGRLHEAGVSAWLREQDAKWRCPSCGAPTAAGSDACTRCGHGLADL